MLVEYFRESELRILHAPLAVLDGDCRLSVPGADNALTGAAGNATFDAIGWMATPKYAKSMGHNITGSRVRWVRSCCCMHT
jgi:hypothetical protein